MKSIIVNFNTLYQISFLCFLIAYAYTVKVNKKKK